MRTNGFLRSLLVATIAIMVISACSSSDDENNSGNSGNSSAELFINDSSYGVLPYVCFINNGDGTGSFLFCNQNIQSGTIDYDSSLTYLSVRIPYISGDIPTGVFSGSKVDADFDVNRILSSDKCDMTGWSTDLTVSVQKAGNKYAVSVVTDKLHIYHSNSESGNGTIGSLKLNYEGGINIISKN